MCWHTISNELASRTGNAPMYAATSGANDAGLAAGLGIDVLVRKSFSRGTCLKAALQTQAKSATLCLNEESGSCARVWKTREESGAAKSFAEKSMFSPVENCLNRSGRRH